MVGRSKIFGKLEQVSSQRKKMNKYRPRKEIPIIRPTEERPFVVVLSEILTSQSRGNGNRDKIHLTGQGWKKEKTNFSNALKGIFGDNATIWELEPR